MIAVKTEVKIMKPITVDKNIDVFGKVWKSPNNFPQCLDGSLMNKGRCETN